MNAPAGPAGFAADSSGVWCIDATPGAVARLAGTGFDWVCVDAQHGTFGRTELIAAARSYPADGAALVVRVARCGFAEIGVALDAGARAVIVPQVDSADDARRAVAATFYPPLGGRSFGQLGVTWGESVTATDVANARTGCAVMIESATALDAVEEIAAVKGVTQLFVGPYDLSLTLGTTVEALVADDSETGPLRRIVRAAQDNGLQAGAFGGEPLVAARFRALGLTCVAVATDLWLTAAGVHAALPEAARR